jgi:hypothetical protein
MVRTLEIKKNLSFLIVFFSMMFFISNDANAAMAVFDGTALGKAIEQIKEMKAATMQRVEMITKAVEQVNILNDVREIHEGVSDAIGEVGRVTLPITSLVNIESQLRKDGACLIPQIPNFGINFDEVNTSICERTKDYNAAFFTDEKDMEKLTPVQQYQKRTQRDLKIQRFTSDTVSRTLAGADVQKETIEEQGKTADQLQNSLDNAKTEMDRLHVIAQTQIAILRVLNNQTQVLTQTMKLQGTIALTIGVNPDVAPKEEEDE